MPQSYENINSVNLSELNAKFMPHSVPREVNYSKLSAMISLHDLRFLTNIV